MKTQRIVWSAVLAAILGGAGATMAKADAAEEKSRDAPARLVGEYVIVSGERDGVAEPGERVKGTVVRFSEDRVVVTDKQSKELYGAEYKLDSRKKPWSILMTSKLGPDAGKTAHGLIQKDGDTIKLVYAIPGGDDPTEFRTKEKQLMFVMKAKAK